MNRIFQASINKKNAGGIRRGVCRVTVFFKRNYNSFSDVTNSNLKSHEKN